MKIYVYTNIIENYCSGDYYFIAHDKTTANYLAGKYSIHHNKKVNGNTNYTIKWDEDPKVYDIVDGYCPLNRITLDMQK